MRLKRQPSSCYISTPFHVLLLVDNLWRDLNHHVPVPSHPNQKETQQTNDQSISLRWDGIGGSIDNGIVDGTGSIFPGQLIGRHVIRLTT